MAFSSNDFSFSLTPGTGLGKQIIITSTKVDSSLDFTLSTTVSASDDIVRILGASSVAVRT